MSDEELLEVMDEQGNVVRTISREEAERDNHLTKNVLIFVFTPNGDIWIQKRPKTKKHFPGLWDISACGGIVKGESPIESAQREQLEEMGITCELQFIESFLNEFRGEDGSLRRRFSYLFIGISEKVPTPTPEVDEFRCVPSDTLKREIQNNPENFVSSFLMELEKAHKAFVDLGVTP